MRPRSGSPFGSSSSVSATTLLVPNSPKLSNSNSTTITTATIVTSISLGSTTGSNNEPTATATATSPQKTRGRKRKRKEVTREDKLADVTSLLKSQFARASELRSGIPRVPPPTSASFLDERSSSPSLSATLSPDDQLIKNDLFEKYYKSQSVLKSQIERQYQDRLARNEFQDSVSVPDEDAETNSSPNSLPAGDVTDAASIPILSPSSENRPKLSAKKGVKSSARRKKQELKATAQAEAAQALQNTNRCESEADILSKLPPIDPTILDEFVNFVHDDSYTTPVEIPPAPTNSNLATIETERLHDSTGSWMHPNVNVNTSSEVKDKTFDFGDSDDDDDDFVEVQSPKDFLLGPEQMVTSPVPPVKGPDKVEEIPLREVAESEVTRLHDEHVENLNGNFDKAGTFREWHETRFVTSYDGDDLLILPYCVIDF